MDYVDDYLFDGIRVLLGEDGSVVDLEGKPVLQYVWGKYWVNNHAHIVKASGEYSLEAIYVALRRTSISHIVTGAVQMKISQRNLQKLELSMPNPESLDYLQPLFATYRNLCEENNKLATLRDALLPRLMSGEIDVSEVDLTQLNSHLAALWSCGRRSRRLSWVSVVTDANDMSNPGHRVTLTADQFAGANPMAGDGTTAALRLGRRHRRGLLGLAYVNFSGHEA